MLKITDVESFRAAVAHKEEIRESLIGHGCTSFCYMISGPETFDSAEARECRGIVFNAQGQVNGRSLHKFFNVNEREETLLQNLDWSKVTRVMDKRDGSMIHTVSTMDGIILKSKKSFESDVAKAADDWMNNQDGLHVFRLALRMSAMGKTCIFEWTAPTARIVLFYPEAELQLLHVRDNETGEYMPKEELYAWAKEYGVKVVEEVDLSKYGVDVTKMTLKDAEHLHKTVEDVEGWVIQFEDGNMVKLKTDWYIKRHHAMTFVRERDIAELVLDEGLDDMKAMLVGDGVNIDRILEIERDVAHRMSTIRNIVEGVVKTNKEVDRKTFAMSMQGHEYFGLFMRAFVGQEPDYRGFFIKHILKQEYGLEQVVMMPSMAEGD
jgi:RNA ligase